MFLIVGSGNIGPATAGPVPTPLPEGICDFHYLFNALQLIIHALMF